MAPKPRSEQHKTGRYYAREAGFRHSEVRILPPQPASPVSRIGFRIFWKPPTLPGFSRCTKRLSGRARCKFRTRVPNLRESLRSKTCHIRIFSMGDLVRTIGDRFET